MSKNIVIAGLTAAGKTTHCLLIARALGFDYLSASQMLLEQLGMPNISSKNLWIEKATEIEQLRGEGDVDRALHERLVYELATRKNTVFDSWSLPWAPSEIDCLRVWIESTFESRLLKAKVSHDARGVNLSRAERRESIGAKDRNSAERFVPLLGVDIRNDRTVFDIVLDNSIFIEEASLRSVRRGIRLFHGELMAAIEDHLGKPEFSSANKDPASDWDLSQVTSVRDLAQWIQGLQEKSTERTRAVDGLVARFSPSGDWDQTAPKAIAYVVSKKEDASSLALIEGLYVLYVLYDGTIRRHEQLPMEITGKARMFLDFLWSNGAIAGSLLLEMEAMHAVACLRIF